MSQKEAKKKKNGKEDPKVNEKEDKGKDLLVKCGFLVALWINAVLEEMVALIMTVV